MPLKSTNQAWKRVAALVAVQASGEVAPSALEQVRALRPPLATSTVQGEEEGTAFWNEHANLIQEAWSEWEFESEPLPALTPDHLDARLRVAVESAWNASTQQDLVVAEECVMGLWQTVAPGVYAGQLLDPHKIADIRKHLQSVEESQIPTRRPNGMNRYGYILEPSVEGAVGLSALNEFYKYVVEDYVRPLGRLFFKDYVGAPPYQDDVESYAFTIRYKQDEDLYLAEHSDASLYTLNVNLNNPDDDGDKYQGSNIYFVEDVTKQKRNVTFAPGMAMLHRGMTRHAAQPIAQGERTNLVIWVYGQHGYVRIAPYEENQQMTPLQRWTRVQGEQLSDGEPYSGGEL